MNAEAVPAVSPCRTSQENNSCYMQDIGYITVAAINVSENIVAAAASAFGRVIPLSTDRDLIVFIHQLPRLFPHHHRPINRINIITIKSPIDKPQRQQKEKKTAKTGSFLKTQRNDKTKRSTEQPAHKNPGRLQQILTAARASAVNFWATPSLSYFTTRPKAMYQDEQALGIPSGSHKVNDPYWTGEERLTLVLDGVVFKELYDQAKMDDFHGLSDGTHPYGARSFVSHESSEGQPQSDVANAKAEPESNGINIKADIQTQIRQALKTQALGIERQVKSGHETGLQEVPRYVPRRPGAHVSRRQGPQPKLSKQQIRTQRVVRRLRRQMQQNQQQQQQQHKQLQQPQPQRQVQQSQQPRQMKHAQRPDTGCESNTVPVAPHRGFLGPHQGHQSQSQPQHSQDLIPNQIRQFSMGTNRTLVALRRGVGTSKDINNIPIAPKRGY
ncbi:hypothetical protein F53441_9667 [Fusarium austroafricanum]|uniref:Uncharacterized protein n=1 Tax=Fusarium austroafricanum TaxID=2364996 RepID=A0A8H4NVA6_9HYPO|nr:hypothetical protein F53441_9667 [Fusarium austroafricanum]